METIKNDKLKVEVSEHGAELQSIKDNGGEEYLWQGDPAYWGRRSPILFPIVGTVCDNTCRVGERSIISLVMVSHVIETSGSLLKAMSRSFSACTTMQRR